MAETRPTRAKAPDSDGESADAKEKREAAEREAAEKEAAEREAERVAAEAAAEPGREEHTVEALIEGSRMCFNCSPHIVAGALRSVGQDTFTQAEAQDRIDAFLAVEYTP